MQELQATVGLSLLQENPQGVNVIRPMFPKAERNNYRKNSERLIELLSGEIF